MGKTADARIVEYAYVNFYTVHKNHLKPFVGTNNILLTINYELKDGNKELIKTENKQHFVEVSGQVTDAQALAIVDANLETLILADKLELSGYQPVEE